MRYEQPAIRWAKDFAISLRDISEIRKKKSLQINLTSHRDHDGQLLSSGLLEGP